MWFCGLIFAVSIKKDDDQQYASETSGTYNVLKERTVLSTRSACSDL